jgi:site-specific DNA-methyltransferase (adenine-specific)
LAFGGTRTYHRLACAVEDAGFEVRDCIAWMYGSGFPKSLDVSKAIDKAAGAEREVVEQGAPFGRGSMRNRSRVEMGYRPTELNPDGGAAEITAPATPEAERWDGWGTALKPAFEPIVVARKPLVGTVAANVLAHGTGALNIDGCRIEGIAEAPGSTPPSSVDGRRGSMAGPMDRVEYDPTRGRWPANVALDPDAAAILDEQAGELTNCGGPKSTTHDGGMFGIGTPGTIYADQGGASRFFYCAKTSREERNAGLDAFAEQQVSYMNTHGGNADKGETWSPVDERTGHERDRFASRTRNPHPTVKPIELMRWLVRLVTPPGGLVFDPFVGSGTTGCAAVLEGFRFIGVEREALYVPIARARIGWWAAQPPGISLVDALEGAAVRRKVADTGQTSIFDTEAA